MVENKVEEVVKGSPADRAGVRPGDRLISINGRRIRDAIDLMFYSDSEYMEITVKRGKETVKLELQKTDDGPVGIRLAPVKVKTCRNRCIFCFVNQLPRGLRRSLYIKDEDFRMSFLYGNYITLTNLTAKDKKRIIQQHLSPLYISVHATDTEVRRRLLGNRNAPPIMNELTWLAEHRIRMHTQIVLCPGYNDGEHLRQTIQDLLKLYPYVQSIAVVPVGITRFVKTDIRPLTREEALNAIEVIKEFQRKMLRKYGDPVVLGSDELYIKANQPFPPLRYYGDFPQIENGVGMVPLFMAKAKRLKPLRKPPRRSYLVVTGVSFYPFLRECIKRLDLQDSVKLIDVDNQFFGETVTVTGLLSGRDIIRRASDVDDYEVLVLPDVTIKEADRMLIDDVTVDEISEILGKEVAIIESTPKGLLNLLEEKNENQRKDKTHRYHRVSCQA